MGEARRRKMAVCSKCKDTIGVPCECDTPHLPKIAVHQEPKTPTQIFTLLARALNNADEEEFNSILDDSTYDELLETAEFAQGLNLILLDALARKEAAEPILVVRG